MCIAWREITGRGVPRTWNASQLAHRKCLTTTLSKTFGNEVPALAHSRRQSLVVHGFAVYPLAGGRALACKLDISGLIGVDPVLIGMHGQPQMAKHMDQWRKAGNKTRFAHVSGAGIEVRDVLLRRRLALLRRLV